MSAIPLSISATGTESSRKDGKFLNTDIDYSPSFSNLVAILKAYVTTKRQSPAPEQALPVRLISADELKTQAEPVLYRLSHSTMLIYLDGEYILTDPVFSDRASPVQWAGPKRFHPLPLSVESLPKIKAVVVSHDHYDHLDHATVMSLAEKVDYFITPLKVGDHLRNWGIEESRIIELDWWQGTQIGSLKITATPTQHFSGRSLFDRDKTLWASWVIEGQQAKLYFSGDSGYFKGFKEIGERFGPFDITMIETGAYNTLWSQIHMLPEQSLQAHLDLKGKAMLPIHNSSFDLSLHDWQEPLETIYNLAQEHGVHLLTPTFGEKVNINSPKVSDTWWRKIVPQPENLLAYE